MKILDSLISGISPAAGVRRLAARQMLEQYQERDYASARSGRRNKGWTGRATSANVEVASSLRSLRSRSHEFVRDHWAGRRILDVLVSHAIGTGIQSIVDTGNDRLNITVNDAIQSWSRKPDIEGMLSWGGMQALAMRSMAEGGESVVRQITQTLDESPSKIPLQLQGLESEQIDSNRDRHEKEHISRLGVGLGEFGQRTGLWLFNEHPGDLAYGGTQSSFVEWDKLCHLYRMDRFGQLRGISWFASILLDAKELMDLREAVVAQERTRACFAGFLHRKPGGSNPLTKGKNEGGQKVTRIEPGMIADIGDSEISFASPSGSSTFGEVNRTGLHAIAAGAGITFDQLTGDLKEANFVSLRAGKIEFRRLIKQIQHLVIVPGLIDPIIQNAVLKGEMAGMYRLRKSGFEINHIMPAIERLEPKKDLEADIAAVRSGALSPQDFITSWGRPWEKVIKDMGDFLEFLDKQESGMALDIDPRQSRNGGKNAKSK